MMHEINLQTKTNARKGQVEMFWFENEFVGLKRTLFHRITIPLAAFQSGLSYESQPVKTAIIIDWIVLDTVNPTDLDGVALSSTTYTKMEASVYIGSAHNWCEVLALELKRKKGDTYYIKGTLHVEFENEGVAQNEPFDFETTVVFSRDQVDG
jgi:hypothetical protein